MENSFVDYRDRADAESDSDTEIIDDSVVVDESFSGIKKTGAKNKTVFVAASEESSCSEGDSEEETLHRSSKSAPRRSSAQQLKPCLSSDDDASKRGSIRRQSETSSNKVVISSSEEEEMSPEMVPKRRLPLKAARLSESFIGRKTKKRIMVLNSDSENSFVIEQERRGKMACLKDTPVKIETDKPNVIANVSFESDNCTDDDDDDEMSSNKSRDGDAEGDDDDDNGRVDQNDSCNINGLEKNKSTVSNNERNSDTETRISTSEANDGSKDHNDDDEDDGPDEDQMVLSRATRMSIMGFLPKENDSDESDYIQSDTSDTKRTSQGSLTNSITDLPADTETSIARTPEKEQALEKAADTSKLTCSPFTSPLQDITNEVNNLVRRSLNLNDDENDKIYDSISLVEGHGFKKHSPVSSNLNIKKLEYLENVIDDDVTIIDKPPEIIALSSDDEDVVTVQRKSTGTKKSPNIKKSPRSKSPSSKKSPSSLNVKTKSEESASKLNGSMKQYLLPPSYPNQVVYVKKHVRENELSKLNGLREELQNIRYLLEHMEMETLPDGGMKLIERLSALEGQVQRQGDKVAAMVVEPDEPTREDIARDGFGKEEKTPSWEEIQKGSNAVQPRMFGKQAMATHMAERSLILTRLGELHASLASRPPEHERAAPPRALRTKLMPHQLHALAWLRWRETQRPPGGILADDMGLGKTITMISLIALDKESSLAGGDDDDDDEHNARGGGVAGGTLVVCPASLVQQWAGEVRAHCAAHALSVAQHHGAAREKYPSRLAVADVVITTYNILQRETGEKGVLTRVRWRRVILDEAHVVRNHKSATAGAVWALRARRRWALTGTPLHNKDLDLFALLKFLRCTPFDDLAMWKKWIDNKSVGGEERMSMIMRCLMLRRTKALLQSAGQLGCLPARSAHDRAVALGADEMGVYKKVLVSSKTLFAQYLHQRSERQAGAGGPTRAERDTAYKLHKRMVALQGVKPVKSHEILVLLLRLRQMCCHCGLIAGMLHAGGDEERGEDPAAADLLAELDKLTLDESRAGGQSGGRELEGGLSGGEEDGGGGEGEGATVAEALRSVLSLSNPVFDLQRRSAKIDAVMECLNNDVFPKKGEKAVVVSQWTSVLRLVERQLVAARVRCVTLSGAVPVRARAALVDQLNDARSDVRVMLLSLCAGGVGLNLVGANHLLLVDPHWNPQLEQQAQDRVYRVGQIRPVHIYRFMCVDTVEQSIRTLQQAKLEMAENVLTGARNTNASKLTIDDLKVLFNMGPTSD